VTELVIGLAALAALTGWLVRRSGRRRPPPRERHPGIDLEELEAAEREVREAGTSSPGAEEDVGDDWGPGVPRR
jgi:hypothetical protein